MVGKTIVVTHKDYEMPVDEMYLPVCVGVGIPALKDKFQPDNVGENISDKNSTYCELTAIYWAWKKLNLSKLDYVGVAHYRRHFSTKKNAKNVNDAIQHEELDKIMSRLGDKAIIATPPKKYLTSIQGHYERSLKGYEEMYKKDIKRLKDAIHTCSPNYDELANKVLNGHEAHTLNIFIMSSKNFNAYCEWIFLVIDKVVALSDDRDDQRRFAGALSEFCLDIWGKTALPSKNCHSWRQRNRRLSARQFSISSGSCKQNNKRHFAGRQIAGAENAMQLQV